MVSYKRIGKKQIALICDSNTDSKDIIASNYNGTDISYSHSSNIVGVATTRDKAGIVTYHAYQTNECGYLKWDESFSSLSDAKQYAEEMYEGFIAYSKALILSNIPPDKLTAGKNVKCAFIVREDGECIALPKILSQYSLHFKHALDSSDIVIIPFEPVNTAADTMLSFRDEIDRFVAVPSFYSYSPRKKHELSKLKKKLHKNYSQSIFEWQQCEPLYHIRYEVLLRPSVYADAINERFSVRISERMFEDDISWNQQMRKQFKNHDIQWTEDIVKQVRQCIADSIPSDISDVDSIFNPNKTKQLKEAGLAVDKLLVQHFA